MDGRGDCEVVNVPRQCAIWILVWFCIFATDKTQQGLASQTICYF